MPLGSFHRYAYLVLIAAVVSDLLAQNDLDECW